MKRLKLVGIEKRSSFQIRLFLEFFSFLMLPVLLLGLIGMSWASKTVLDNTLNAYQNAMESVGSRIAEYVTGLNDVVNLFCKNVLLSRIAYMQGDGIDYSRISLSELQEYKNQLVFHCKSSRIYDDVAICFPQKNSVISTMGIWQMDWFLEDEFHVLNMEQSAVQQLFEKDQIVPSLKITTYGVAKNGVAFFKPAIRSSSGKLLMSVIFWTNEKTLNAHLADLLLYDGTLVGLIDRNGNLIGANKAGTISKDDINMVLKQTAEGYEALSWYDAVSGFRLNAMIPKTAILGGVRQVKLFVFFILVIVAVMGCALSWELAMLNYQPLDHLFKMLGEHLKITNSSSKSEMAEIEEKLLKMINEQNELRASVNGNKMLLQYAALSHLLDGDKAYQALAHQTTLSMLDIRMPYAFCRVLCIYHAHDEEHLLGTARAISQDKALRVYNVSKNALLFLLVNYENIALFDVLLAELSPMCDALCVSGEQTHPSGFARAFVQATETLARRSVTQDNNIYYFDQLPGECLAQYSVEDEKRLLGALRSGSQNDLQNALQALLKKNNTLPSLQKLILALEMSVLKTDDSRGALTDIVRALKQPDQLDAAELVDYARRLLDTAAVYHQKAAASVKSALAEKLLLYIDENLCDEQLSLSMTAEKFSLSTAYLSRYFKEQFGIGYLDYVNQKRVLLAKELLAGGSCNVHEAAQRVGFENDATLRRVFKKYEGVVPSLVCQENGGKNEDC